MKTKICIKCGKEYHKKINRSVENFKKSKYCSVACAKIKHGLFIGAKTDEEKVQRNTPEYNSWHAMKQRCFDPNHEAHKRYIGITICDRWLCEDGFKNFLEDMGKRPKNKSLDRIDNGKGYYKENCKWSTPKQQANNTRSNVKRKKLTYKGVEYKRSYLVSKLSKSHRIAKYKVLDAILKNNLENFIKELEEKREKEISNLRKITLTEGKYLKRNKLILNLRINNYTLKEIGDKLGLTRERVRQIIKSIIK